MLWQYSDGDPSNKGIECKDVWKNRDLQPISCFISKICKIWMKLLWNADRKPYPSFRIVPFSVTLKTRSPHFKVTSLFVDQYLRSGSRYRYNCNGILIWTYTRPNEGCYFEWFVVDLAHSKNCYEWMNEWVILTELVKYSMTWSIGQSLCDSWAS